MLLRSHALAPFGVHLADRSHHVFHALLVVLHVHVPAPRLGVLVVLRGAAEKLADDLSGAGDDEWVAG